MTNEDVPLRFDAERSGMHGATGIYVRAKNADGHWGNADIAEIDRVSLFRWLRSRGGENLWAENTVMLLLGWPQFAAEEAVAALKETTHG